MRWDEQDELLNELLTGEEVADLRQASLARGLADIRRRRHQRRAVRLGALALLPLVAGLGILLHQRSGRTVEQVVAVKPAAVAAPAQPQENDKPKVITDEQLFALFPGRSMALIGKPGEQRLVFLDGGEARSRAQ